MRGIHQDGAGAPEPLRDARPEVAMWCAVIERAVMDYHVSRRWREMPQDTPSQRTRRAHARQRYADVRAWLLSDSEAFPAFRHLAREVAGIDPDRIIEELDLA